MYIIKKHYIYGDFVKDFLYVVALAQIAFTAHAGIVDIESIITNRDTIKRIEHNPHGTKKSCEGELVCQKFVPVKVTYCPDQNECNVVDAYVAFYVNQPMVIQNASVCFNDVELCFSDKQYDKVANLNMRGSIKLPYAEILFPDEERALQFKEAVDVQCYGKTSNILKRLDSHYYRGIYKGGLIAGAWVVLCMPILRKSFSCKTISHIF